MWKGNGWWEGILRAGFHVPISQSFITLGLPGFISFLCFDENDYTYFTSFFSILY